MPEDTQMQDHSFWYKSDTEQCLNRLDSSVDGLSTSEAARRLETYGPNEFEGRRRSSLLRTILHQFSSPLIYILLIAMIITALIQHWEDTIVIALVLLINAVIGTIQEHKAENAIEALSKMLSPQATVLRDGSKKRILSRELVPGDMVQLEAGSIVSADMRLIYSSELLVNEAALTGESQAASKLAKALSDADDDLNPGDQLNLVFMGTQIPSGTAKGLVYATGSRTQMGRIAKDLKSTATQKTPLQIRMEGLSKWISVVIVMASASAAGMGVMMGRDLSEMFLTAVAIAVSAIPEGLPIVMTVALAICVRRMAQRNAVVRHLPAVETLGNTNVIVSDKTGTLTQNQMTVTQIYAEGTLFSVSGVGLDIQGEILKDQQGFELEQQGSLYHCLLCGALNNDAHWDPKDAQKSLGDPMEVAFLVVAHKAGLNRSALQSKWQMIDEVPFRSEVRFAATIHQHAQDLRIMTLLKGAPERIAEMCTTQMDANGQAVAIDTEEIQKQAQLFAQRGMRTLAMAWGEGDDLRRSAKSSQPQGFCFVGLQGIVDPPRSEAIDAVHRCHQAGIRVIMCTGDHATTAAAIAKEIGIGAKSLQQGGLPMVISGQQVAVMSADQLGHSVRECSVFARMSPDQKLKIVNALKEQSAIVTVTGDGVNDAPALKSAHLGVAMGITGTDVAKEASEMVLADDNFASIYAAAEEGRTAFSNIRMATFFLLASAVGEVLAITLSILFAWPLPMLPAQILWLNVATNGITDVALAFEKGDHKLFARPPRPSSEGLLSRRLLERLMLVGIYIAIVALWVFNHYWQGEEQNLDHARVVTLTTIVVTKILFVFSCRSEFAHLWQKPLMDNKVLFFGALASFGVHVLAMHTAGMSRILSLQPLQLATWLWMIPIALGALMISEGHKALRGAT